MAENSVGMCGGSRKRRESVSGALHLNRGSRSGTGLRGWTEAALSHASVDESEEEKIQKYP
ncbi:hypothetical protein Nans01_43440 [Nocardiopsis ansamitocini]|uniref:Uncharacterized protein n=1 Tax=Nocardiopsis ansamitocini TaxID=1670832 RepID=A0A9W6PAI1_9ACTN|nr:hypothetical protein Nans01_43440 [Nocardiopsis ansamitocini]